MEKRMALILADTNVIIYMLEGDKSLSQLFDDNEIAISFITELELLSAKKYSPTQQEAVSIFIQKCAIYHYDGLIKQNCIDIRIKYSLKLPDAIIAATSKSHNLPLLTSDKHFAKILEIKTSIYTF